MAGSVYNYLDRTTTPQQNQNVSRFFISWRKEQT
jgi:hypothetical protein